MNDYMQFRGKCKKLCIDLIEKNPELTLIRGHYFCPLWNKEEQHFWCVNKQGDVVDPSKKQFPSKGHGIYTPFNGIVYCEMCSKEMKEEEVFYWQGKYPTCSDKCAYNLIL